MNKDYITHNLAVYAGYLNDDDEILTCSSGGIATAFSRMMIRAGGYVVGATYSEDFCSVRYEIADSLDQLERFKGSKYVDIDKGSIYQDVKELLDDGKQVLFFGVPCMVSAMRMFLKKEYSKLICCELVCEGPTTSEVHKQYIQHLEKKYGSKVVDFSVRRKRKAWTPKYLYAKFENGTVYEKEFRRTEYGFAFKVMGKPACYDCKFKATGHTGDILLGDYWGATEKDSFWNKNGVSAIFVQTEKGKRYLFETDGITLFPTTYDRAVAENPMVIRSRMPRKEKQKFEKLFEKKGLIFAAQHSRTLERKVKDLILNIMRK